MSDDDDDDDNVTSEWSTKASLKSLKYGLMLCGSSQ